MTGRWDDDKVTPLRGQSRDPQDHYNPDAEQLVIGALFINNKLLPRLRLRPENFGNDLHRRIFAASEELIKAGKLANAVTLKHQFDIDYLKGLAKAGDTVIFDEHAVEYAHIIANLALLREIKVADDVDHIAKLLERRNGHAARSLVTYDAADIDPTKIVPRGWLLGTTFCRKFISGLIAEGGAGKTAVRYAQYLALASGRRDITGEHVHHRGRVLLVCLEDDLDEVRRRIAAAMLRHGVSQAELRGWLHYCTPQGLKLLQNGESGGRVTGELYAELKTVIGGTKIDLVGIDPFVKAHGVEENDNNAIDQVCGMLAGLAAEFNCAIDLISHARKGTATPGDAERDRGASAKRDAGRLMRTLTPMSSDEAGVYGINDQERRTLVRVDDAKTNLNAKSATAMWFRIVGVPLGNRSELYPNGDVVHTVERWTPPDAFADVSTDTWCIIIDEIDAGTSSGRRYTNANNATDRAAWKIVVKHLDRTEQQARAIINTWVKTQVFTLENYHDPVESKTLKGLSANPAKRPGNGVRS